MIVLVYWTHHYPIPIYLTTTFELEVWTQPQMDKANYMGRTHERCRTEKCVW